MKFFSVALLALVLPSVELNWVKPMNPEAQRLLMLSASAAMLCQVSHMKTPEEQVERTTQFLRQLDKDYPGQTQWLKSQKTFDGAVKLSRFLNDNCRSWRVPKKRVFELAKPYL